jgi:hypothetical protein
MSENRRRPTGIFWVTVVLCGLSIVYVASFGPWCWLMVQQAEIGHEATPTLFYRPILWVWYHCPVPIGDFVGWYASLASSSNLAPGKMADGTLCVVSGLP